MFADEGVWATFSVILKPDSHAGSCSYFCVSLATACNMTAWLGAFMLPLAAEQNEKRKSLFTGSNIVSTGDFWGYYKCSTDKNTDTDMFNHIYS